MGPKECIDYLLPFSHIPFPKVEIGGGELFRTIGVYKSKIPGESKVGGSSVSGITSDDEFR